MIKLICDWCGKEEEAPSTVLVRTWLENEMEGEPNTCTSCAQAWNGMQTELKQRVVEARKRIIGEMKAEYLKSISVELCSTNKPWMHSPHMKGEWVMDTSEEP